MQASVRVYGRGGEGGDTFLLSHVCGNVTPHGVREIWTGVFMIPVILKQLGSYKRLCESVS